VGTNLTVSWSDVVFPYRRCEQARLRRPYKAEVGGSKPPAPTTAFVQVKATFRLARIRPLALSTTAGSWSFGWIRTPRYPPSRTRGAGT